MYIIKTFIIVNFAVVRKKVITQVLNFVLDRKIAGKVQNGEVVKIDTLTKRQPFFQIIHWLLLTFILCKVLSCALSKAKMPKVVSYISN